MPKMVDIAGQRFGRLTAIERIGTKWGKALWSFDCDCGTKGFQATQNQVQAGQRYASGQRRGHGGVQSCGCWNRECLFFGPNPNRVKRPRFAVPITFPVPAPYPDKSDLFNDVMRRRYQFRWERVEFEARKIENGTWKEPQKRTPKEPRDEYGNVIERLDLLALAARKRMIHERGQARVQVPDTPASFITGASLADRVRVVSDEEWARL
jgi:hypothetical protein